MINTSSYDAVRRLTWELALIHYKASEDTLKNDKDNHTVARTYIESALQFLGQYNDAEVHLTKDEPFANANYTENNPFQTPKQYSYKQKDAQKHK